MNSPEFEFGQSSDERAELLVLLGGEGWTLICRGGGRQWVDHRMVQMNLLLSQQDDLYASKKKQSDFTVSTTYLHQAVKGPLLVIEKQ